VTTLGAKFKFKSSFLPDFDADEPESFIEDRELPENLPADVLRFYKLISTKIPEKFKVPPPDTRHWQLYFQNNKPSQAELHNLFGFLSR
jgi:hypothetical protein